MALSARRLDPGEVAGSSHGLRRLIVRVQPVAPGEVAALHRHDGEQILIVLRGEVRIEVDGDSHVCREGEIGIAPTGAPHAFRGLDAPALLEVIGEQGAGTWFLLDDGEIEVHRPGLPWDRPGPATDMDALAPRLLAPAAGDR